MKFGLEVQGKGLDVLANIATEFPKQLPKQIVIINNKVAKWQRKEIGKEVRKQVSMKAKDAIEDVYLEKKAEIGSTDAHILIEKTKRPSLKRFGARQVKKGVSYRISKKGKRKTIPGAFGPNIGKLNGHVFVRAVKARLPIYMKFGPSVAAVYQKNNIWHVSESQIKERQEFEIARRIRALTVSTIRKQGRVEGLSTDQINQRIKSRLG